MRLESKKQLCFSVEKWFIIRKEMLQKYVRRNDFNFYWNLIILAGMEYVI